MIQSANKIIGSLVYRTREALRNNSKFLAALEEEYPFAPDCFVDGKFSLWHYPGTHDEITGALLYMEESQWKFPSLLNFQEIKEDVTAGKGDIYHYKLAFAALTNSNWMTQERERYVFDLLLIPVYVEFMKQLKKSRYFSLSLQESNAMPNHTRYKVFTTGKSNSEIINMYGDYADALEIHNLTLQTKNCFTNKELKQIEEENDLVNNNSNLN
jgi:hypothetical protein